MTAEDLMRVCLDLDQQCLTSRPSPWGDAAVLVSRLCHAAEGQIGQPGKDLGDWRSVDLSPVMQGVGPGSDQSTVTLIVQLDEARMHRDRLAEAVERVTWERDAMVARWPDDRNGAGPVLYQHSDGRWWLETIRGDSWPGGNSGPFPAREAAVRAAAGLDAAKEGE